MAEQRAGDAQVIRDFLNGNILRIVRIDIAVNPLHQICGTGGDRLGTFSFNHLQNIDENFRQISPDQGIRSDLIRALQFRNLIDFPDQLT